MAKTSVKRQNLVYSDKDHCVSLYGNVILSFSLQPPNPHYLRAWTAAMDRLVASSVEPIAVVTIIDSQARPPDEASKNAIRACLSKHATHTCAFVYVVEGKGFAAAAMRSVLSLISMAARYPFPQKAFSTPQDAAAWVVQRTPATLASANISEMVSVIETMRHQLHRPHLAAAS
jgi:hypothetical protein